MERDRSSAGAAVELLRAVGRRLLRIPFPLSALPVTLWGALIWQFSSYGDVDGGPLVSSSPIIGNLAHAFVFGMLALWFVLVLPRRDGWPALSRRVVAFTFLILLSYALADEWHQGGVPERNASLLDVLTDGAGIASVLVVIAYLGRPGASASGLRGRLLVALLACLVCASLATVYQGRRGPGPWPFGSRTSLDPERAGLEGGAGARIHSTG